MPQIDFEFAFRMLDYAGEAYNVVMSDQEFNAGYTLAGEARQTFYSKDAWLEAKQFTQICNPRGDTTHLKYWGVAGYDPLDGAIVVALRGTDFSSWNDIAIDGLGGGTVNDPISGNVSYPFARWTVEGAGPTYNVWAHKSFLGVYRSIRDSVWTAVQALMGHHPHASKLIVVGHSLGGGLSTLCCLDLAVRLGTSGPAQRQLVTFASPYAGNPALAEAVTTEMTSVNAFVILNDWVTKVPTRGWTPAWIDWFEGGQHGPEPRRFADYNYVTPVIELDRIGNFPTPHYLHSYFHQIWSLEPAERNPHLDPEAPITALTLGIQTGSVLGAGTDVDVFTDLLGKSWGPLDKFWNDFERHTYREYDLLEMFPGELPSGAKISDIQSIGFHMGRVGLLDIYTADWKLDYVKIKVNGMTLTTAHFNTWLGAGTSSGNSIDQRIHDEL